MTTPSMAFSMLARNALGVFVTLWMATFLVTRTYILHEEYVSEMGARSDETWLVEKCKDTEFYANLRQHSDLCTRVQNNARASIVLRVLSRVMSRSTHLCGTLSCTELAYSAAERFGWHVLALVLGLVVLAPNFVVMFARGVMQRHASSMEEAMFSRNAGCLAMYGHGDYAEDGQYTTLPGSMRAMMMAQCGRGTPVRQIGYGNGACGTSSSTSGGVTKGLCTSGGDGAWWCAPVTSASTWRRSAFFRQPIQYGGADTSIAHNKRADRIMMHDGRDRSVFSSLSVYEEEEEEEQGETAAGGERHERESAGIHASTVCSSSHGGFHGGVTRIM